MSVPMGRAAAWGVAALSWVVAALPAAAHIGSPDVVFDGQAGPYPVRVIIQTPGVVPGLADITVRLGADSPRAERVLVRPVHVEVGLEGSPRPDEAAPVRGDDALYTAELWLMTRGSYSVYVTVHGEAGEGTAIVPVHSAATERLEMHPAYGGMLIALGLLLVAGLVRIAGAAVASTAAVGTELDAAGRRRGHVAMVVTLALVALVLWGGKTWWDNVDAEYLDRMWNAYSIAAEARLDEGHRVLEIHLDDERWQRASKLAPDHGKLMHMFLIREPQLDAFAHLHPIPQGDTTFAVTVPPLPAGSYRIYADVTHESGVTQTLTEVVELPEHGAAATTPFPAGLAPDPDDSLHAAGAGDGTAYRFDDGHQLVWHRADVLREDEEIDLRFELLTPTGEPAALEPYMGMLSHAAVRRHDGEVFIHLHPTGTISMAAQELFARRAATTSEPGADPAARSHGEMSHGEMRHAAMNHSAHAMSPTQGDGTVAMPYRFPRPGTYRVWVQVKSAGTVYTGVFDAELGAASAG